VIIINKYETMLILNPAVEADRQAEILERLRSTIESTNGTVTNVDDWGKRKLAYEINGLLEGIYVIVTATAAPQAVAEAERVLGITDEVVRFKTLRLKA
jgi:small subunit ribosomal protein S6